MATKAPSVPGPHIGNPLERNLFFPRKAFAWIPARVRHEARRERLSRLSGKGTPAKCKEFFLKMAKNAQDEE
jgi:hypothetical protein